MFEGLNIIPWSELTHAYGSAEEVPMWLRQLTSDDELVRRRAYHHLGGSICHEGFLCDATAYAVPYLVELLQEPTVQEKDEILDLLTWIAKADPIEELLRWQKNATPLPPAPVPIKDAHAAVGAGVPTYIALLDAPALQVRMQAASVLVRFPERAQELWPFLQAALEREHADQGRINLVCALSFIGRRLPEQQAFFVAQFHANQDELSVFAAALALAWLAKTETPQEVTRLLAKVAIEAPASLEVFQEPPCGDGSAWWAALNALCTLGSARLQFLAPRVAERLASPGREEHVYQMEHLAMLLLFIVFGEATGAGARPEEVLTQYQQRDTHWLLTHLILGQEMETDRPPRPANALTERQREALLLVLRQDRAWFSNHLAHLLSVYGPVMLFQEGATLETNQEPSKTPAEGPEEPATPRKRYQIGFFGLRKEFTTVSVKIPGIEGIDKRQTMKACLWELSPPSYLAKQEYPGLWSGGRCLPL